MLPLLGEGVLFIGNGVHFGKNDGTKYPVISIWRIP